MKLDDVLRSIGEFGIYQKRCYLLIALPTIFHACQQMNYVFLLGQHAHRCKIPNESGINITENSTTAIYDVQHYSVTAKECEIYTYNNHTNETTQMKCSSWEYDDTIFTASVTSEFNLVCDNKMYKSHASMASFSGGLLATILMGTLGDIIGRRKVLCISVTVMFVSDVTLALSPNIYVFSVLHFLTGFSGIAYFGIAIISELVGPTKRTLAGLLIEMVWSLGMMVLCTVAYFIRNWRYLQIAVSAPSFVLLFYWLLIPESPRWLLARGRKDDAIKILKSVAVVNKKVLPDKIHDIECETKYSLKEVVLPLLQSKSLFLRWIILTLAWLVTAMAYFGLSYNVGRIAGDLYVNFLLAAVVEFIGYVLCLILSAKCGRKLVTVGSLVLAGLGIVGCIFTTLHSNEPSQWGTVALSLVGKCGVSIAFANIFVYTPELFPTNVRSFVTGCCNTGARIGTLISPYIANIADFVPGNFGTSISYIIFGGFTIMIGLTCMVLPETLNTHLPETIEEAVNLRRKHEREESCETQQEEEEFFETKTF